MIITLSSFIHFRLYTDYWDQNFLSHSDSDLKQNQNEMRFFFDEMRQNWTSIWWDETESDFFSWDEMKQKAEAVLMRWNWIFMRQNISFWFFSQSNWNWWVDWLCCADELLEISIISWSESDNDNWAMIYEFVIS